MPRLIDSMDSAIGRTPATLDTGVDYLTRRPSPEKIIGPGGVYNGGWFEDFTGAFNFKESSAFDMAFQRFFHCTLDAGRFFIAWNIADFYKGGNTTIFVVDKESKSSKVGSISKVLPFHHMVVSEDHRHFLEPETGSFLRVSEDGRRYSFSMHVAGLHLSGVASLALGPPLVQCTRFQRGRGSLQWYGCMRLEHGTLTLGDEVLALPPGAFGTFDRTMGHQRGLQGWNWIAGAGTAVDTASAAREPIGLQIHRDREDRARPWVASLKHAAWVGGELYKFGDTRFEYSVLDEATAETTPWLIRTAGFEDGADGVSLVFRPAQTRLETKVSALISADFRQHFGPIYGDLRVAGRSLTLDPFFVVVEDSHLQL